MLSEKELNEFKENYENKPKEEQKDYIKYLLFSDMFCEMGDIGNEDERQQLIDYFKKEKLINKTLKI